MSEQNDAAASSTAEAPAAAPKAKRAPAKPKAKPTKKADPKPASASPVTKPQLRILTALSKTKGCLNRQKIADKAGVALSWVSGFTFAACAANTTKSLCEQGFAKRHDLDVDGKKEVVAEITQRGRQLLARLAK